MRIEPFFHKNVDPDGKVDVGGAVETTPRTRWSKNHRSSERCQFLIINCGRNAQGAVYGVTIYFDTDEELEKFLAQEDQVAYT